jgi:alanyl-tRNA synthetase
MTERLYYTDAYLRQFTAKVASVEGANVYLDRTAFYPTSGGQSHDLGALGAARVVDVIDEEDRIAHVVEGDPGGIEVECEIDWPRRFDHMRQHTGQHLLSAVFADVFGFETVSVHLGAEISTLDLAAPAVDPEKLAEAEREANERAASNLAVTVSFEDAALAKGLRKASQREGTLRVVEIAGLDRSACGGTHVRSTAEIGAILLGRAEKVRQTTRVEFVCGRRAVRSARAARAEIAALTQRLAEAGAAVKKLESEAAALRGAKRYFETAPSPDGVRRAAVREMNEGTRAEAIAFTSYGKAIFVAERGGTILYAVSGDTGIDAAAKLKPLLTRGGGGKTLAQGVAADPETALRELLS